MTGRARPLARRPLSTPASSRLPLDHARRAESLAAHDVAMSNDAAGYADPESGLYVLTAAWLAARGTCCENGCRHCPYVEEGS
ncbi:MAG: hypothetical protein QOJ79_1882 [Actinomycetota bacterium]|jgi:hypothetical protein|nr:hypothetical protein [Actinomycetota bacterium]